ncbi:hypothetical protein HDV04_001534 [Boothiomyces sp. JEL0838]|nr:hypothetical protein HDV04_001534 [Boothiomyces sp. JEL0838]
MAYAPDELQALFITIRVGSAIGIVGLILTFVMFYMRKEEINTPIGKLMFAMTVAGLVESPFKFIGRDGVNAGINSPLCISQALIIIWGNLASIFFYCGISLSALYLLFFDGQLSTIKSRQWIVILVGFLFPAIPTILVNFLPSINKKPIIGDADLYFNYQIALQYIIVWASFIFNTVALIFIWIRMTSLSQGLHIDFKNDKSDQLKNFVLARLVGLLLAFFISWVFPSLYRIVTYYQGPNFTLAMLLGMFGPSRGISHLMVLEVCTVLSTRVQIAPLSTLTTKSLL